MDIAFVARLSTDAAIPKWSPSKNEPTRLPAAGPVKLPTPAVSIVGSSVDTDLLLKPRQEWVVDTVPVAVLSHQHFTSSRWNRSNGIPTVPRKRMINMR